MIFKPVLARAVASGKKTQTRRPVTPKPCRYKVGHDYAVQPGRGKEGIARIKVLDIREERVGQISHQDAKAEGFRNQAAFKAYWTQIYDAAWVRSQETVKHPDGVVETLSPLDEGELAERFSERHAHKLVTVIRFELVQDTPRFLAQPGPNQGDYTEQRHRAIDDLEVIDDLTATRYAKKAAEEAEKQRASFRVDLERERKHRAATSPRGLQRIQRGRSLRDAA